jgi:translation initiation factor 2B subunit (eIF-2B alpha/beta/delta family)
LHSQVRRLIARLEALDIHASRSAREVMQALLAQALDSQVTTVEELVVEIKDTLDAVLKVMPAYAPPINTMNRFMLCLETNVAQGSSLAEVKSALKSEALAFERWSQGARDQIAQFGSTLIRAGTVVFTFTLSETVMSVLRKAKVEGKDFRVLVTESRPNADGFDTAKELTKMGINVAVSLDACLDQLIQGSDLVIVGAEAVMSDGSLICKVGTYPALRIASSYGLPVIAAVDTLKFYPASAIGIQMTLDAIRVGDVLRDHTFRKTQVWGHLFDKTPPDLITGILTERGVLTSFASSAWINHMPRSNWLSEELVRWKRSSFI